MVQLFQVEVQGAETDTMPQCIQQILSDFNSLFGEPVLAAVVITTFHSCQGLNR